MLASLSRQAARGLAVIASRVSAPTVFFGVLLWPAKAGEAQVVEVPGHPGLRIVREKDELRWTVIDASGDGDAKVISPGPDGTLRDAKGNVVGRVLSNDHVAIELKAVAPARVKPEEPQLCPAPSQDKYGQGPDSVARAYEDQVKRVVNPEAPTPSGLAYQLFNPNKAATLPPRRRSILPFRSHPTDFRGSPT